jgi:hypothetical protein
MLFARAEAGVRNYGGQDPVQISQDSLRVLTGGQIRIEQICINPKGFRQE